ncbi:MAG: tetratricopeptide repeat protein [Leptolyngbya sp. IPPAS B-1204]|nr:tetratricopeptide repeat protein [Elainella sp. C42_A2020_010]RNJ67535.1 MAG: tetratricopeptide repeat protein [Leptolyngbya sp. IPPAS B-1204]
MLGFLLPLIGSVSYAQTPSNLEPTPESSPESTPEESPPSPSPSLSSPPPLPPAPVPDGTVLNPLEPQPDPLLPEMVVDRPLNPQEKNVLRAALNELQAQAEAKLQAGDLPGALELWNRELRLRRYLGPEEEVAALTRVGEVAWRESQATELRFITLRLEQIEQEVSAQPEPNYDLLLTLAQAYQTVRARNQSVALYQKLLERAKQQQNTAQQQQILTAVAEQHLGWFDYPNAALAYEELLTLARSTGDRATEVTALEKLAYIYKQNNQPELAITAQQQLVESYQKQNNFVPIPALKIAIADSYVLLNRPDFAATNYQEAFAAARSVQQYAYASDALSKLATLYRSLNRLDDALIVYQLLLDVERQSYNSFGMMTTYDQLGQLHRDRGDNPQALAAFQQGLQIAQQLNYRVDYFNQQIQQIAQ